MWTLDKINKDIQLWSDFYKIGKYKFLVLFVKYPEFRCLLKMRLKYYEAENKSVFLKAMRIFVTLFTRFHNLYLYTEPNMIGDNLLLHHAFATVISAEKIGDNCHIYQQVTIGNGGGGIPIIGNNVTIYAGAKVFGKITIGDDVIIGANAVVTKDIPSHSMVAGVPAKIIKTRNDINEMWIRYEDNI